MQDFSTPCGAGALRLCDEDGNSAGPWSPDADRENAPPARGEAGIRSALQGGRDVIVRPSSQGFLVLSDVAQFHSEARLLVDNFAVQLGCRHLAPSLSFHPPEASTALSRLSAAAHPFLALSTAFSDAPSTSVVTSARRPDGSWVQLTAGDLRRLVEALAALEAGRVA